MAGGPAAGGIPLSLRNPGGSTSARLFCHCEAEEGLRGIVQECAARGEVVRASKVVPNGPCCVYWWKRFPSGYRPELEIGEP
jgi:hypothetical protein